MPASIRPFVKWIHLVLSLPAGVFLTIVCLTGAALVYQEQIERLVFPDRFEKGSSISDPVDWNQWLDKATSGLSGDSISAITLWSNPSRSVRLKLSSGARMFASADRCSGDIQTIYNTRSDFFYSIKKLHRWLGDDTRTLGRCIVGISSISLSIILLSGLLIWLPRTRHNLLSRFLVHFRKGRSRLLFDQHTVLGVYAFIFLLLPALTGPIWSFGWYYKAVANIFNIESEGKEPDNSIGASQFISLHEWAEALNCVVQSESELERFTLQKDGKVSILTDDAVHDLATDEYLYSPSTRSLVLTSKYADSRDDRFMMGWVDVLHTGNWGGHIVRFITFLACLIGASLPITGYILYFRKRIRNTVRK